MAKFEYKPSDRHLGLAEILASATRSPGRIEIEIPPGWMQGRTSYGGLSTALAYEAAKSCAPDLPPLGSVQVNFIGPVAGRVVVTARIIRRGKSVAFVSAELDSEQGKGLQAVFIFANPIQSAAFIDETPPPATIVPYSSALPALKEPVQDFRQNLEIRFAAPPSDTPTANVLRWVRLREQGDVAPTSVLLALGDALHPAALAILRSATAISTLNWMVTLTSPDIQTDEGWWLIECRSNHFRHGLASQTITMWNSKGGLALHSSQSVAIFG